MSKLRLKKVFEEIGGESQVKVILRDFYSRMAGDILIGYFFTGKDITAIADRQAHFLLFAVGLKPSYEGNLPPSAHLSLPPILKGHFDRRLLLLKETLKEHGLTDKDIRTWVSFENAFRAVVVSSDRKT